MKKKTGNQVEAKTNRLLKGELENEDNCIKKENIRPSPEGKE